MLSWLLLRGRCRQCGTWIGVRYPLVELAVALLWAGCWIRFSKPSLSPGDVASSEIPHLLAHSLIQLLGYAILCWLLVALAALDAEHFWLPDLLTLPGIGLGLLVYLSETRMLLVSSAHLAEAAWHRCLAILASAGLVLFIRLSYWIVRRQEGMGLGDAKLMAMLGAWLGLRGALESFALAIFSSAAIALLWLAILAIRRNTDAWARMPLPLGTFLCAAALTEIFYPHWLLAWWIPGL